MHEKAVLENGLRVLTTHAPHTRAVSVAIFVGAGSRYEDESLAGASHFVEHMLFKGTERRPVPREIAEAIEGVGGVMNAATDKEVTVYWAKVPVDHFTDALDVLLDQLLHSKFDPAELERERRVVIEELAMVEDSPGEIAALLLDALLWPNQALGRDIAGSEASVAALSREVLLEYVASQYVPENVVVSIAGDLPHQHVVAEVEARVGGWDPRSFRSWERATNGHVGPQTRIRSKRTEQAQIGLGYPSYSSLHPDRYALDLMNGILGEGMSSRLFEELREKRGLAYGVQSSIVRYLDTGAFAVGAAVDPSKADETVRAIRGVLEEFRSRPVPEVELQKVKRYMKGRFLLRMEDSRAMASFVGSQELLHGTIEQMDDVVRHIDAVTTDDIQRVARDVIRDAQAHLAVVGPFRSEQRFAKLLN
ncbi:MAG: insulinase family protein [Chloroflexi bacterium]|nr:insulinase family protein [Chloroflexota bacterium]